MARGAKEPAGAEEGGMEEHGAVAEGGCPEGKRLWLGMQFGNIFSPRKKKIIQDTPFFINRYALAGSQEMEIDSKPSPDTVLQHFPPRLGVPGGRRKPKRTLHRY